MVTYEKSNVWVISWYTTDNRWDSTELNGSTYQEVRDLFFSMADEFMFDGNMDTLSIEQDGYEVVARQDGKEISYARYN